MARQQIYLNKDRETAIAASGKTILELIDLGLEAVSYEETAQASVPDLYAPGRRAPLTRDTCKHPPARRAKGLCMACGTNVGLRG
jgi:hypothetical protein